MDFFDWHHLHRTSYTDFRVNFFLKTSYTFNLIYESIHRDLFCILVAYLILASTCNAKGITERVSNFLSLNFWYPIAQISYSTYLFHIGFMMWVFPKLSSFFYGSISNSSIIFVNIFITMVITFCFFTSFFDGRKFLAKNLEEILLIKNSINLKPLIYLLLFFFIYMDEFII